jgi:hypothetical protein
MRRYWLFAAIPAALFACHGDLARSPFVSDVDPGTAELIAGLTFECF